MPAWCGCCSPANLRMFESLASIYFSPVLLNSEEIDPVNAWATLGTIGRSVSQTGSEGTPAPTAAQSWTD